MISATTAIARTPAAACQRETCHEGVAPVCNASLVGLQGQPKVADERRARLGEQDIRRLDVAVNNPSLVGGDARDGLGNTRAPTR